MFGVHRISQNLPGAFPWGASSDLQVSSAPFVLTLPVSLFFFAIKTDLSTAPLCRKPIHQWDSEFVKIIVVVIIAASSITSNNNS